MLKEFRVSNFKSFRNNFVFDLSTPNGYAFNSECIKHGIVNNALIYGPNGVGKSNLGLAIFDIIEHLTDKQKGRETYRHYTNLYNESSVVEFYYSFLINGKTVVYEYKKLSYETIIFERLSIDNTEIVLFDRSNSNSQFTTNIKGAETLNKTINDSSLSVLKYIKNNTSLVINGVNTTFSKFFDFIDSMLFFKSLDRRMYMGYISGSDRIDKSIIEKNNHKDLESFLNKAGVDCTISIVNHLDGSKALMFDFNGTVIPWYEVASTGTDALILFYHWFQSIKENKVPFVFIDEFDAFYHHELSAMIIRELKKTGTQFILTTHNISNMTNDLLRPDCYFLMNSNKIKSLSNCTDKELREAHNIEKMYKAHLFDVK